MFNKGHTIEEVDMQFMQTNKFFIKKVLKGDVKTKVMDDSEVYKDFKYVNSTLVKKNEDHFEELQIRQRVEDLREERNKSLPVTSFNQKLKDS
jgi:hypothetical protein